MESGSPSESDALERYGVRHAQEIQRILRGVMDERSLVTVSGQGERFLVTTILGCDAKAGEFFLGCSDDERVNAELLASEAVTFSTMQDQVRVQFVSAPPRKERRDGVWVLRVPVPKQLLYFQRREFYRLPTSLLNPVTCRVPMPDGDIEAILLDISIGGGMISYRQGPPLQAGRTYTGCRLALPGGNGFAVNLRVLKAFDVPLRGGTVSRRAGCQFVNLPPSLETEIQRFITRVERERRSI